MSCSGETVDEDGLIRIKPGVMMQLKKAKYGVSDHSTDDRTGDSPMFIPLRDALRIASWMQTVPQNVPVRGTT